MYPSSYLQSWLGGKDSNLDSRLQRPMSYHWTTPQEILGGAVDKEWYRPNLPQKDKRVPCGTQGQKG